MALIAFYSLAAYATPRRAAVAGLLGGAGWIADDLRELLPGTIALEDTIPAWFILAAAWGMGYALHGRQAEVGELTDRADRLEREREAALATERARIARDLHDVVAHSLSVMIVQAQAAERVLEGEETSARDALASIDSTGRQAMVEMRRLVGMLRDDGEPSLAPRPGLGQLAGAGRADARRRPAGRPRGAGRASPDGARRRPVGLPHRAGGADEHAQARRARAGPGRRALRRTRHGARGQR